MAKNWEDEAWDYSNLDGMSKLVILSMARDATPEGLTRMSVKDISQRTGVCVSKVGLAITQAVERGFFQRASESDPGFVLGSRTAQYRFQGV